MVLTLEQSMGGMDTSHKDIGENWKFSEEFLLHSGENVACDI